MKGVWRERGALWMILAVLASFAFSSCITTPRQKKPAKVKVDERPIVAVITTDEQDVGVLYRKAERLFSEESYESAAKLYIKYLQIAPPESRIIDNAYFKIGMCWFELERYRDALHYFQSVWERFPESEVYTEALINSGVCQYHLNNYTMAQNLFGQAASLVSSAGQKAYIHFYQANISDKKGAFPEAISLYVKAETMADNEKLVVAAHSKVERILHNFVGEQELLNITKKYSKRWPADVAYVELINIYQRSGDLNLLENVKALHKADFPSSGRPSFFGARGKENYTTNTPKIGAILPLSGRGAQAGREMLQGVQLAFNSMRGLIQQKKIQPIIKDSSSDSDNAIEALKELGADRDILLAIGPAFSEAFERAATIADGYYLPVFSPSATAQGLASLSDKLFRNSLTMSLEVKKLASFAVSQMGMKRFAIIFPENNYGKDISALFIREVERLGAKVVAAQSYGSGQTDFGAQVRSIGGMGDDKLRKIILSVARANPEADPDSINTMLANDYKDSLSIPKIANYGGFPLTSRNFRPELVMNYDAIFTPGAFDKVGLLLPELAFYNIKNIEKFASKEAHNQKLLEIADKYTDGVIFIDGFFKQSGSPHVKSFVRNYRLAFREEPTMLAAQSYDATRIALSGIAHGASSRKAMSDYLLNLQFFEGVSGVTSMGPDGDADKTVSVLTVKDGKIVEYTAPQEETPIGEDDTTTHEQQLFE